MTEKTADLAPGAARKLSNLLDKAEKQYGTLKLLKDVPPLEQALFLILREGNDYRKAHKALQNLTAEYVEWNELRVATPKEVVAVLKGVGLNDVDEKVSRILALLSRLFYDFHKKDLEFVRIFDGPQREKILRTLEPLGLPITYVLLQEFDERSARPEGLVVSMEAMNRVADLGLTRKTSSTAVAKKLLEKLVPKKDWYRFHYYLLRA